jgi:urea transport system permease protein
MIRTTLAALAGVFLVLIARPTPAMRSRTGWPDLQTILQDNSELVADASRRTVQEVLDILVDSQLPEVPEFLATWQARELYQRESDGLFRLCRGPRRRPPDAHRHHHRRGARHRRSREVTQLRPNRGVQGVIAATLVQFQLASDDPAQRLAALDAIEDDPEESICGSRRPGRERDRPATCSSGPSCSCPRSSSPFRGRGRPPRGGDPKPCRQCQPDARATLNPLLTTRTEFAEALPEDANIARELEPRSDALSVADAYAMLVDEGLAPALIPRSEQAAHPDREHRGRAPSAACPWPS